MHVSSSVSIESYDITVAVSSLYVSNPVTIIAKQAIILAMKSQKIKIVTHILYYLCFLIKHRRRVAAVSGSACLWSDTSESIYNVTIPHQKVASRSARVSHASSAFAFSESLILASQVRRQARIV
jgi:hypothetical protein